MIEVNELTDYLDEYLEEKQEVKNLTEETIKKQTFNISKFIEYLENEGIDVAILLLRGDRGRPQLRKR